MNDNQTPLLTQIKQSGIIVHLPASWLEKEMWSICDALLAAPITAVELYWDHPETAVFAFEWLNHAPPDFLIGINGIRTNNQLVESLYAGASWISSDQYNPALATQLGENYWPIMTANEKGKIALIGQPATQPETTELISQPFLPNQLFQSTELINSNHPWLYRCAWPTPELLVAARHANPLAIVIREPIITAPHIKMSTLIQQARQLLSLWLDVDWD